MKIRDLFEVIGNGAMYVLSATQTKEIFEIISLVLSIVISILIVVGKIVDWYRRAKADGKITQDEINEGIDIVMGGVEDVKDKIKDKEE